MSRRFGLVAALAIVVGVCVGCDPGWVNPVLGTGDGSGSVPGAAPGVAVADVAAGTPSSLVDLGARGFLVYDEDSCTIMSVAHGAATRYAGNGTCGDTGDGGPALDAQIEVMPNGVGAGLQADPDGNVYFVADEPKTTVRRIDAVTGVITTVFDATPLSAQDVDYVVLGVSAEANGTITVLLFDDWNTDSGTPDVQLRRIDAAGDETVVASYAAPAWPNAMVRVGPEHYVILGNDGDDLSRTDVDHGVVTTATVTQQAGFSIPEAVDANGDIYGITNEGSGTSGNHVFRLRSDGTFDHIAGAGLADPDTTRQMGPGASLDLSVAALAMTHNGNLLVASGHVVYDLIDPADAPAIPSSS